MAWDTHCQSAMAALVSITLLSRLFTDSSPVHRRLPDCFRAILCTSAMMELMPCALAPAYWCDFDVVSSRLPPPFPSIRLSPLVASAVSGLRTLFVWFCFFCFCYPRPCASACSHFNRRNSPTLHPVISTAGAYSVSLLLHPAAVGGSEVRTPRGVLRKVRDSNPRATVGCRVSGAVHSSRLCQPSIIISLMPSANHRTAF